jgi:hypothetical protein
MKQLSTKLPWPLAQTIWPSQINPILANPIVNGQMLENVILINGTTSVNHGLQRNLQGWFIVGINKAATIYDNQASNQTPQLTLSLISNAVCTVNIWVF